MKLYLDDERATPEGWVRAYTVEEAQAILVSNAITHLSVDNDLGEGLKEGYTLLDWIEQKTATDASYMPPEVIAVHSANSGRRVYMLGAVNSIRRFVWSRQISSELF